MKTKLLIGLCALIISIGFTLKNPVINSDASAYNGLKIDSSTLKDIEAVYGFDYEVDTWTTKVTVGTTEGESIPINKITYPKQGVSFIVLGEDIRNVPIYKILFAWPFKGSTEKNIIIGKSTFRDVIKQYGAGQWSIGHPLDRAKKLSLLYSTITFRADKFYTEEEYNQINKDDFLDLVVSEIILEGEHY
ncbi:MAG: hypothetical protein ACTHJT_01760 [Cytophaga sp.]|uniref:hypothetical protein n=1 Tax=Cytophaga sp. TaxID=29535 RepID=UPI003F7F94BC